MNKKDLVMLIMAKKTLDYQKDPNPENWRTIKGAKVHIDENGKIDGGAGGKFNGKGALPRSMFSGTGKQTEFAEVTEKKKEIAERAQKEKETQKAERKKERAAAQKTKRQEKRKLEKERPELKQKFNDLRESYLKETDPKKKRELRNQALEVSQEYFKKYGNHPDNDGKPKEKKGKSDVGEKGIAYLRSISHVNSSAEEETGYTARTMIDMINKGKTLEEIRTELRKNIDKYSHDVDNDYRHVDKMIEAVKRADKGDTKPGNKPAAKNSAAENLIDYVKEQLNIDLSKHRNTEREKRGQLLVNWKELDRNQKFAIQTLAQKGKFELIDNGGYGYILKPTKEPKNSAPKSAENKDVRVKLSNGVTLRWQEVPGEPDKVYNPETREMYDFKGGLKAAIERAKSQGATVEEYEKETYDPYQAESKNRQDRRLARSAAATRRAGRSGRPTGAR